MDSVTNSIIDGMARALYTEAYASAIEEHDIAGNAAGPGEDWMDVAPSTPDYAHDAALRLSGRIEERNGMSLVCLIYQAAKADGIDTDAEPKDQDSPYWHEARESRHCSYAEAFGHYLAMASVGHGVCWFDDHAKFPLSLPLIDSLDLEDAQPSQYRIWSDEFEAWHGEDFGLFCAENGIDGEDSEILERYLIDRGVLVTEQA